MDNLIEKIKKHPDYNKAGMILCHNGVVRETSRDGKKVSELSVKADRALLKEVIEKYKKYPGIIEILIEIKDNRKLLVGDDVMKLVVAGDIRENVISALSGALNEVKKSVTSKTEFFI
ncbi:MAG: molybdenum cofactor biosynthesis protein MoaE [Deltaproteobacteria bacterium]|nr:molybdenum cofactor biosynthesis protein MoaE [Deltaproteobacteria bacterium]